MTDRDMFGDFAGPAVLPPTPLPWRVDSDGLDMAVIGADGAMVACNAGHMPCPVGGEDMALIVRAVNAYAPLVEALRAIAAVSAQPIAADYYTTDWLARDISEIRDIAFAVLAKQGVRP